MSSESLYQSKALKVLDSKGWVRTNLLKRYLSSTVDAIRFYHFMGKVARIPLIGIPVKQTLSLYYRYLHTNSLIFPIHEMEKVIETATDIQVDPCPCRVIAEEDACDAPLYTCMRINHTATVRKEIKGSKSLSKENALSILKASHAKGLVLSLESCIQPYHNNICMCCSCCCIAMKMRYDYGIGIYNSGPYLPFFDPGACTHCGTCETTCPVDALSMVEGKVFVDQSRCLGCGLCAQGCPSSALEMVFQPSRIRQESEPGPVRLFLYLLYIYSVMIPSIWIYKRVTGSKEELMQNARPNDHDVYRPSMQAK